MKNLAVVGMGSIAKRHIKNLRRLHSEARIVAVSSTGTNTRCPDGADAVVALATALESGPDYIIVATPAAFHLDVAQMALDAGIPVLIEKPLSSSFDTAKDFADLCRANTPPPVGVGYCLRFLSTAKMVRGLLQENSIGKIYNVSAFVGQYLPLWRPDTDYKSSVSAQNDLGGGALLELSHELDLLNWFFNDLTLRYSWLRPGTHLGIDVEESANLVLTRKDGCHVTVHLDFLQPAVARRMSFAGHEGRIEWDLVENSIRICRQTQDDEILIGTETDRNQMYLDMVRDFEGVIAGQSSTLADVQDALKTMAVVNAAKQTNQWTQS